MDHQVSHWLAEYLLALGDDELILGHRDSEWCGHAPILEEDIAFANLALDEIGHATTWYGLVAQLTGQDPERYPDQLVFERDPPAYRCAQLVELPNGDWAFTMLRQYFFDAAEIARLSAMEATRWGPLASSAGKIRREELYHIRHSEAWVRRLGLGTEESHLRLQNALDKIWPLAAQLFRRGEGEAGLVSGGWIPDSASVASEWENRVRPWLEGCHLSIPAKTEVSPARSEHTSHLKTLIRTMQSVHRLEPGGEW